MDVNKIIKNRRLELKLTLKDVATALGVAESTISRYETSDIQNMGIDKIEALSKILRCTPSYLMGWNDESITTENISLKSECNELLSKYNFLDEKGKHTVNTILDMEYNRCTSEIAATSHKNTPYIPLTIAAHSDDENDMEKLNSDIDMMMRDDW